MNNLTISAPNQVDFLADNASHRYRFDIPSSDGTKTYRVAQAKCSGQWQCDCPSWLYQKGVRVIDRKPCKHLREMSDLLLQIEGKAPSAAPRLKPAPAPQIAANGTANDQIAALVAAAERELADAQAKVAAATAKVDALRMALKAVA